MNGLTACCCCYRKGTNFQANHNPSWLSPRSLGVVVATAKVQIFKQITTKMAKDKKVSKLLLLPQRYKFSSKSQRHKCREVGCNSCCCYRKGTNFQANHNWTQRVKLSVLVVVATAKVQIFKQITTQLMP